MISTVLWYEVHRDAIFVKEKTSLSEKEIVSKVANFESGPKFVLFDIHT